MIFGIGCDCMDVGRMGRELADDSGLETTLFTEAEIRYCRTHHDPAPFFAARFAAKEALFKALSPHIGPRPQWLEIEIVRDQLARPSFRLHGQSADAVKALGISCLHLSLSHARKIAMAFVVVEQGNETEETNRLQ